MKSIFSRLLLSFFAIILTVILSIGVLFTGLLRNYLLKQKAAELKSKGSQIIQLSQDFMNRRIDEVTFIYMANSIDEIIDSSTIILDKSGVVINVPRRRPGRDGNLYAVKGVRLNDSDIAAVISGTTFVKSGYNPLFNESMITVGIPVFSDASNSAVIGAVILNSPVRGVRDAMKQSRNMLVIPCLSALILSLLGAYFLSRTLSRPITSISKAALEMAEGDYSKKVDIKREDEIGSLASSFNYLTEKLSETIGDLNNEKSKLSDILQSMEEGLIAVDNNLDIIHMNPTARFLLGNEDQDLQSLSDVHDDHMAANVQDVLSFGRSKSYNVTVSESIFLNVIISPLRFQNGRIYGAIILLQDISESMKLENMRRDFVANVSHELRTPLTSIRGFIEPLIDGTVDDEKTALKYHKIIRDETLRLGRLINDLLDLSRFQAGKVALDIQEVDITELISNVSNKFQSLFASKDINFKFNNPEEDVMILADGDRIEQLMIIFIDNATKFTPKGGTIEIGLKEEDNKALVSVKDSGIGIPKEDVPYIWDRFYKADKSRTGKDSGTGLGLSIAKNIISLHGEKVWVESSSGEGTCFTFTMKRASIEHS